MKFARNVHFRIQDGKKEEFTRLFNTEVLPMLRKHDGFRNELTLVNEEGARGISIWDDRKSAEAYETTTFPKVLARLKPLLMGEPRVVTYDVALSTLPA